MKIQSAESDVSLRDYFRKNVEKKLIRSELSLSLSSAHLLAFSLYDRLTHKHAVASSGCSNFQQCLMHTLFVSVCLLS